MFRSPLRLPRRETGNIRPGCGAYHHITFVLVEPRPAPGSTSKTHGSHTQILNLIFVDKSKLIRRFDCPPSMALDVNPRAKCYTAVVPVVALMWAAVLCSALMIQEWLRAEARRPGATVQLGVNLYRRLQLSPFTCRGFPLGILSKKCHLEWTQMVPMDLL